MSGVRSCIDSLGQPKRNLPCTGLAHVGPPGPVARALKAATLGVTFGDLARGSSGRPSAALASESAEARRHLQPGLDNPVRLTAALFLSRRDSDPDSELESGGGASLSI